MAADVRFEVHYRFDAEPRTVWDELVDWKGHEAWIPATRVQVDPGEPTAVGATFTAFTGYRPLVLEDRMRVSRCEWDDRAGTGHCEVEKLGPILTGRAGFTVEGGDDDRAVVCWTEEVTVPYAPGFSAPLVGWVGALGFRVGMRKLAKLVSGRSRSSS
jgi:hypothetical protein